MYLCRSTGLNHLGSLGDENLVINEASAYVRDIVGAMFNFE